MNPISLSRVLQALSRSAGLVPDEADRDAISEAAEIVAKQAREPQVLVCGGPLSDPVVNEVEFLSDSVRGMADDLHEVADHVEDVLRLLREQRNTPTADGAA